MLLPIGKPYRFDEAVEDEVVLDLRYEARDIDQRISSPKKIDEWFEMNTKGLTPVAKAKLKQRWGTLQKVLSSKSRLDQIAADIIFDMNKNSRLSSGRGNAMLVAGSIPEACRFFEIFRNSGSVLADKCAIITSYERSASQITGEETGMGETDRQYVHKVYDDLLSKRGQSEEEYEDEALRLFKKEPGQMKLLIVVSRLLTGFDAPPASVIYIDKKMQDHGLFQAICRVNRLDGDDKEFGYIVDYKDLFKCIEGAIEDYTSAAFDAFEKEDVEGLINGRAEKATNSFQEARDAWFGLLEPVEQPKGDEEIFTYFSFADGPHKDPIAEERAQRRQALYKFAGSFARCFEEIASNPESCGYDDTQIEMHRQEVERALSIREAGRLHSGDAIDMKQFEPAMRHLIDNYIKAEDSERLDFLEDISLVDLITSDPDAVEESLPKGLKGNRDNVAEAIENNVRRLIIDETPVNPKFYDKMSDLLEALVEERRADALEYAEYLRKLAELAKLVKAGHGKDYPCTLSSPRQKVLFDNLEGDEKLALDVDAVIKDSAQDGWRGNRMKKRQLLKRLEKLLSEEDAERIMEIAVEQGEY